MTDKLLEVLDVSKSFGRKKVLSNVTFHLDKGELVLLRGPNGSGKTTLLRVITEVIEPDSGSVKVLGKDIHEYPEVRREISYCPERLALLPDYTVRKNLIFFSKIFNFPINDILLDRYIKIFRLEEYTDQKISKLSMGTKKKVALLRTLLMRANLYVLDEPLANLDEESSSELIGEIRSMANEAGVLVASHIDLPDADRVLEMRGGRIEEIC